MSLDPFGTTDDLLKFLGLPKHQLVEKFIVQHTKTMRDLTTTTDSADTTSMTTHKMEKLMQEKATPYNTSRNSKATAFRWKKTMKSRDIAKVQRACKKQMKMLGYNLMTDIEKDKNNDKYPMLVKTPSELWSTSD